MTAPTRRAALTALAGVPALAIPAAAMGAQKPNPSSAEPATIEQMAEMNFRPWEHTEDEWKPPSNTEWNSHGTHLLPFTRLAWLSMFKTKAELETIAEELEDEQFEELVNGIIHSREFFENFVMVLRSAEVRIICGEAAVELRNGDCDETS